MTENSSDLSNDIVPNVPRHSSIERPFAPWHKVRKEFVRREQWNKIIVHFAERYLARTLQPQGGSEWKGDDCEVMVPEMIEIHTPLNCLVIPGDDLLDIRSLERDTANIKCYIRYLGFNERHGSDQVGTRLHIAHNDVTSSNRVSVRSRVLRDRFQSIAKENSLALRYVKELGPFHVINLDLCDSLFPTISGDLKSYYDALHRICEYQMKEMATPWLLFITTEVAPNEVDTAQLDSFCSPTKQNINLHVGFAKAFASIVPDEAMSSPIDCSRLNEKQLLDLFGIALGKVLLQFSSTAEPKWRVTMLRSHVYRINDQLNVSMLSVAFQFTPVTRPPLDLTGLSSIVHPQPPEYDECGMATKIIEAVQRISDIDDTLSNDAHLYRDLLESSARLLSMAGYDRDEYIRWVKGGEGTSFG